MKQRLLAAGLLVLILSCWAWVYYSQRSVATVNEPLHEGTGEVLAEETSKLLNHQGQIVVLAVSPSHVPELEVQLKAFEKTLKRNGGIKIQDTEFLQSNDPKYGIGRGLSAKRLLEVVRKHPQADAIVSFIGSPNLTEPQIAELAKAHPKFIAEIRSPERMMNLVEKGVLQLAVVSRFTFPAPGSKHPHSSREWFDHCFQVVAAPTPKASNVADQP